MNSPALQIKERLGIEEVVSSYITLEKAGNNLRAKCPFHNEKSPSFFVSPDRGSYYCFGCQAQGDIFTFVQEFEGLDFKGALRLLAERAGIKLTAFSKTSDALISEKDRLYLIMEEALKYFENNLKHSTESLDYLKDRGINDKSIAEFRIGFAKLEWRELVGYLKTKQFTDKEIEKAGLAKSTDRGMYDRFRGRIMFPIFDSSGRVIAFSGRILVDDGKSAKYMNSPETPIFSKSAVLYGLHNAKEAIRKNDFSIVVEGQFDLILSHQAGFRNTVATSGTALAHSDKSDDDIVNHLGVLKRLSNNVVFVFDSDKAGLNASIRATPIALALFNDMNVKSTQIPDGMDPADLISKQGADAWKQVIRGSKHIIEFLVDKFVLKDTKKDALKLKIEISEKIIPYLNYIKNPIKRAHFMSLISNKSGISESLIKDIANSQLVKDNGGVERREVPSVGLRTDYILRRLLGIIFWQQTKSAADIDVNALALEVAEILSLTPSEIFEMQKDNKEDLIFEAEIFYEGKEGLSKDVKEMVYNLKEEYLKRELQALMVKLHLAEESRDETSSALILKECQIINNKIEDLKLSRTTK